ncbi:MAG: PH domain-containing protein [Planctomycetota bacterium]
MTDDNAPRTPEEPAPTPAPDPAPAPLPPPPPPAPPVLEEHRPGRPEQLGLPPDNDEEQHVLTVRPALFKAHPFRAFGLLALPFAFFILMWIFTNFDVFGRTFLIVSGSILAVCYAAWFVWWVRFRWTCSLYISNKRTIERRGLLSRSSDEVLHDHVRNVNIEQSFFERVFNVGSVGISSAGQADTEIQVQKIPQPDRVKEIIDAYRDDLGRNRTVRPVD